MQATTANATTTTSSTNVPLQYQYGGQYEVLSKHGGFVNCYLLSVFLFM